MGMFGEYQQPGLCKTYYVERGGQGLGYIKRYTYASARFEAERFRYYGVSAPGANPYIGGYRRHRETRAQGNALGKQNDYYGAQEACVTDHPSEAEVHDYAQDREDIRRKNPRESAEFVRPRALVF